MFSMTRLMVGLGLYMVFILVISLMADEINPTVYIVLLFAGIGALWWGSPPAG